MKELKKILRQYSKFLEEYGYTDTDWREEKPTAVDRFLSEENKSFPLDEPVIVKFADLESIKYLNKMRELMNLGDRININARLLILRRKIEDDFSGKRLYYHKNMN